MAEKLIDEYEAGKPLRHQHLAQKWLEHCTEAGHTPVMEGGDVTYDANLAFTYVRCCVKGCKWEYEREVGFSRLPA